jgi:hypothetical protein
MHLSASLKTVPIVLWAEGIVFGFFSWAMLCYFILCLVTLLPDQSDETSLRHPSQYREEVCRSVRHTVTGTVKECFAEVCSTAAGEESTFSWTPRCVITVSAAIYLPNCHSSLFSDELIHFSLCLDRVHLLAATMAPISDGAVLTLKILYHYLTLLAPEQASPYAR